MKHSIICVIFLSACGSESEDKASRDFSVTSGVDEEPQQVPTREQVPAAAMAKEAPVPTSEQLPTVPAVMEEPAPVPAQPSEMPAAERPVGGIDEVTMSQVDDVWVVFYGPSSNGVATGTSGNANIRDGCLHVNDRLVVWHLDSMDTVTAAVAAAKRGQDFQVTLGGFQIADVPAVVGERCPNARSFFLENGYGMTEPANE